MQSHGAGDPPSVIGKGFYLDGCDIAFVLDVPHDLLKNVFERCDACRSAVFISDDGDVGFGFLEFAQKLIEWFVEWDDDNVARHLGQGSCSSSFEFDDISEMHHSNDLIWVSVNKWVAGIGVSHGEVESLLGRPIGLHKDDVCAWDHDVSDVLVCKSKDVFDEVDLAGLEDSALKGSGEYEVEFLLSVRHFGVARGPDADDSEESVRDSIKGPDGGFKEPIEPVEWVSDG